MFCASRMLKLSFRGVQVGSFMHDGAVMGNRSSNDKRVQVLRRETERGLVMFCEKRVLCYKAEAMGKPACATPMARK